MANETMTGRSAVAPVVIAAAVGIALGSAVSLVSGRREAWDAPAYWIVAYPAAILACAWLGYAYPERTWRWPLILFEFQFVAMCIRNGELGNLWPFGVALFAIIALPGMIAARVAARFGRRANEGAT
jgi:peptidoglycan/LPS O-acetylase OafA/YrhL